MGNSKASWTPEEESLLDRYVTGDLMLTDICDLTGRSKQAVSGRAHLRGKTKRIWNSKLSHEVIEQVVSLYREGSTVKEVGEVTHLSYHQVGWCLRQVGITPDRTRAAKVATKDQVRNLTEDEQDLIRRRWHEGVSLEAIAKDVGCWKTVILRFVRSEGLTRTRLELYRMRRLLAFQPTTEERDRIVEAFTIGGLNRDLMCLHFKVKWYHLRRVLSEENVDFDYWVRKKNSILMRAAFASGVRKVSPKAGNGKPTPSSTPFQGIKTMRSTTEARRAQDLNITGKAWFYEVSSFKVDGHQYTPDFWVTDLPLSDVLKVLGSAPTRQEIRDFLQKVPYRIEEVKGWWGPTHPSKPKVDAFRLGFPTIVFHLVVEERKTGGWRCL